MYSSKPTSSPSTEPSGQPSYTPSDQPSLVPSYSPTNCEEYFAYNDPYAVFNNFSLTGYYPFNCSNVTIPSPSPTMRFNSQVKETFNQTYTGVDLVGLTRKQVKGFERFMASLTPLYITSDTGPSTDTSCDLVSQVLSDIARRFLLEVEEDEEIPSGFTDDGGYADVLKSLLQDTDDGYNDEHDDTYAEDEDYEIPPSRLDVVFDITWSSIDQYLNETEYVTSFVEFMNSDFGRNLTLLALQNLSLPIDEVGQFGVWVDPNEEVLDIEISTSDVPTWDVLKTTGVFTLITTIFFLIVFEVGRRSEVLKFVFDQRRATQPFRTPPPLRKRYFEWLLFLTPTRYLFQDKMPLSDYLVQAEEPIYSSSLDEDHESTDSDSSCSSSDHHNHDSNRNDSIRSIQKLRRLSQELSMKRQCSNESISEHAEMEKEERASFQRETSNNSLIASELVKDVTQRRSSSKDTKVKNNGSDINKSHNNNMSEEKKALETDTKQHMSESIIVGMKTQGPDNCQSHRIECDKRRATFHRTCGTVSVKASDNYSSASELETQTTQRSSSKHLVINKKILDMNQSRNTEFGKAQATFESKSATMPNDLSSASELEKGVKQRTSRHKDTEMKEVMNVNQFHNTEDEETIATKQQNPESTSLEMNKKGLQNAQMHGVDEDKRFSSFRRGSSDLSNSLDLVKMSKQKSKVNKTPRKRGKRSNIRVVNSTKKSSILTKLRRKRQNQRKIKIDENLEKRLKKKTQHIANASVDTGELDLKHVLLVEAVGLDAFVMLRYIKFGFHVTFYPFIIASIVLIPIYYTNDYETNTGISNIFVTGYFAFTLNRLEDGSPKFWICWAYAILYRFYTLYRLWKEWELFTPFRFEFFMKGDPGMELELIMPDGLQKIINNPMCAPSKDGVADVNARTTTAQDDLSLQIAHNSNSGREERTKTVPNDKENPGVGDDSNGRAITVIRGDREKYLRHNQIKQLRNSCLVEFVPTDYRTNKNLYNFFNQLFPGQIARVKMFAQNPKLNQCISKRQRMIESYEKTFAKHYYAQQKFNDSIDKNKVKEPKEPTIKVFQDSCLSRKRVDALPYYSQQIKKLNVNAEEAWDEINKEEEIDSGIRISSERMKKSSLSRMMSGAYNATKSLIYKKRKYASGTAIIEFKTLAAAQSGTQSTITGKINYMTIVNAPDPREIIWENAIVSRGLIDFRKFVSTLLLISGLAVWAPLIALITSLTNIDNYKSYIPASMIPPPGTPFYNFIKGYFPVLVLEVLMSYLPVFLSFIATRLIRVKTESETDHFVLFWNSVYRTWNIFIVIVSGSLFDILNAIVEDPQLLFNLITQGIFFSSQFFFDNIIFATGTGLFYEFCQLPTVISFLFKKKLMHKEASSQRELEKLEESSRFDWGDCLPEFLFIFMVAQLYCTNVPILLGVCAVFFFLAYKVFLHQALYIYSPHYESGGSFMYSMSNASFLMIHISNFTLFGMFALKDVGLQASSYLAITFIATFLVKKAINTKFIVPSLRIALTHARTIDEKNKAQEAIWKKKELKMRRKALRKNLGNFSTIENFRGYDYITNNSCYMYQQPQLNKQSWETEPRPYRSK